MSSKPRPRGAPVASLAALVDEALSPDHLRDVAHPEDWPEVLAPPDLPTALWDRALGDVARDILNRPSRRFRARLCQLSWRLADGVGDVPATLPALVEIVHAGSLIVDDIEDDSRERRGAPCVHLNHGVPRALNAGNWMYFWALDLIEKSGFAPDVAEELRRAYGAAMYHCHLGQALDLSTSVGRLPRAGVYRTVATSTMLKTGGLMELAARLGALAARAPAPRLEALARFGRRLGLGLQMLDDFGNLSAPAADDGTSKALEDLRNGRPTWPWALAAQDLDEPTFLELQASVNAVSERNGDGDVSVRALAARLRMAVGGKGRRHAVSYLHDALAGLREAVGDRAELTLLTNEIERVRVSYG